MRNRIIFSDQQHDELDALMRGGGANESAAFLICRQSASRSGFTLVVKEVVPIASEHILVASPTGMSISSRAVTRALKRAADCDGAFVFVHSHPSGFPRFSAQDDEEEEKLFSTAHVRADQAQYHGSLVWCDGRLTDGRLWNSRLVSKPLHRVNVIGQRFQFYSLRSFRSSSLDLYDRQVRAFGAELQEALQALHVGVVGVGGTGSAVLEQLIRLGVGSISLFDGDRLEKTNVNRVYGSAVADQGLPKVVIAERLVRSVGLGTEIRTYFSDIGVLVTARALRDCDVIFGCTDDQLGRSVLTRLALAYRIPIFDMGVKIDPDGASIRSIEGRVTTLMPGEACLFCRDRISGAGVGGDVMRKFHPDEADELEKEGYLAGAEGAAPSVITFTTMIASAAITEFLHRMTGILGADRTSTEVLYFMHDGRVRTNRKERRPDCFCARDSFIGSADTQPFLDMTWSAE